MKKMYKKPQTEKVNLQSQDVMQPGILGVSQNTNGYNPTHDEMIGD